MKININHKTIYNYSDIVPRLIQSVRLFPTEVLIKKQLNGQLNLVKELFQNHIKMHLVIKYLISIIQI